MEEIPFPKEVGETQAEASEFCRQIRERMSQDHPELVEKHLPSLESTDPFRRMFSARGLKAIMDVIDIRRRLEATKSELELNDSRKLA